MMKSFLNIRHLVLLSMLAGTLTLAGCATSRPTAARTLPVAAAATAAAESDKPDATDVEVFVLAVELNKDIVQDQHEEVRARLRSARTKLLEIADGGKASLTTVIRARYFAAQMAQRVLGIERVAKLPTEPGLAQKVVSELEQVSDSAIKAGNADQIASDALYSAARVMLNEIKDEPRAIALFERCANDGHAGCANVVAHAAEHGKYGQAIDILKAARYHRIVVDSGTNFNCAGAFSASALSDLTFFDGLKLPEADEISWAKKSLELAGSLKERFGSAPCRWHELEMNLHLLQRSRGSVNPIRLDDTYPRPSKFDGGAGIWALGRLMRKELSTDEFLTIVAGVEPYEQCDSLANAAWFFALQNDRKEMERMRVKLSELDLAECVSARRRMPKVESLLR